MKTIKPIAVLAALSGLYGLNAGAATLSLEPDAITVTPGSVLSIDLVIYGLGDASVPSVGDFDIDIDFDPLALGLVGTPLGSELGDVSFGEAIDVGFGEFAPGTANVAEVSFLTEAELDTLQPDAFLLATLNFMLPGPGTGDGTVIDIGDVLSLGDSLGNPIPIDSVSGMVVASFDTDGDGEPNASDPDDDNDGIGDSLDMDPWVANNFCIGADAYIFSETVIGPLTCAARSSITVVQLAEVLATGDLYLITPIIIFESGFSAAGLLTVISAEPCPSCSP